MSELSPAAQAVAKAALYVSSCDPEEYPHQAQEIAAAALRAAVDYTKVNPGHDIWQCDANELLAIATELEAQ